MADLFSALPYVVDLDKPITKTMLYNLFVTTNKKAHRFIITLRRGGVDVPFTGSVVGTLINYSDMMTQEYPGRAEDGKVIFDWPASFYAKSGLFCVIITVDDGEVSNSVFAAEGSMILGETDTLYDPSHVVPSLAELLAQIEATRNAATDANNAAVSASRAATDANNAADPAHHQRDQPRQQQTRGAGDPGQHLHQTLPDKYIIIYNESFHERRLPSFFLFDNILHH